MTSQAWVSLGVGIASIVMSVLITEIRRWLAEAKRQGIQDNAIDNLTAIVSELKQAEAKAMSKEDFEKFEKRHDTAIEKLFERLDRLSSGGYQKDGELAAIKERLDRAERDIIELRSTVMPVPKASPQSKKRA